MRGVYYPHGMHTINPYKVVATLAERFAADGGTLLRGRVRGFGRDGASGHRGRRSPTGSLPAKAVVIAAGRASGELTRLLGFNAPLVAERGYHVMLAPDNVRFDLPVSPAERGFVITPMEEGLRVAGTVELAAPHQPPSWHRADLLVRHLKDIFPGVGGAEQSRWIGERPTLPDFRPGDRPRTAAGQRLLRLRPSACRPDARHRDRPADRAPDGGRGAARRTQGLRSRPLRLEPLHAAADGASVGSYLVDWRPRRQA